jgi:hypothetical protein
MQIWLTDAAVLILVAGATASRAGPASAWEYFTEPVTIERTFHDEEGEGMIFSGVELTDAHDRYTAVCRSRTNAGYAVEPQFSRWSDSFIDTAMKSPRDYLAEPRGSSGTMLQWAEACLRTKMLD